MRFHHCLVFAVKQVGFLANMFESCYVTDAQRHVTRVSRSSSRRSQWAHFYRSSELLVRNTCSMRVQVESGMSRWLVPVVPLEAAIMQMGEGLLAVAGKVIGELLPVS